jgi:NADPH-dependent 2,4-dienoyl-CoA reductase/sulfur reductase-like enzyme
MLYFPGVLGTEVVRAFGLAFGRTGVTEQEAKAEGMDVVCAVFEGPDKAPYLPGHGDMAVKVIAEPGSGKLLGVQIAGPAEATLRIDAAAVAVQAGMKVNKLAEVQTAYEPTLSPVRDPLVQAAEQCAKLVKR